MKFSFLSLLLLVLFPVQISFASEPPEVLARKAASENAAEATPPRRATFKEAGPTYGY